MYDGLSRLGSDPQGMAAGTGAAPLLSSSRGDASAPRWLRDVGWIAAVTAGVAGWLALQIGGLQVSRVVGYGANLGIVAFAVVCAVRAALRLAGRQRVAWFCIAGATAVGGGALVPAAIYQIVFNLSVPDFSATLQYGAIPFALGAGWCMLSTYLRLGRLQTLLDGVIVVGSVFFVAWVLGYQNIAPAALVQPMADGFYGIVVVVWLLRATAADRGPLFFLAGSVGATTLGDTLVASNNWTRSSMYSLPVSATWVAAALGLAFAARRVQPVAWRLRSEAQLTASRQALLPYAATMVAGGAAITTMVFRHSLDSTMAWTASVIMGLLGARQMLDLHERLRSDDRTRHNRELQATESRFRNLVQRSTDMIAVLDSDGIITYLSHSAREILGVSPEDIIGERFVDLIHNEDRKHVGAELAKSARRSEGRQLMTFRVRHPGGRWRDIEAVPNNLLDDPSVRGIAVTARDVTERRELEDQLRHQAFHDPLTGLANRALLRDRVEHAVRRASRHGESVALLFVDLDDFKRINDLLGHAAGDIALRTVASRLRTALRDMDTPARLGGDEFAALLEGEIDGAVAALVARRVIDAVSKPISINDRTVTVGASVGIAISDKNSTTDSVMQEADVAMYRAKSAGKGNYALFDSSMDLLTAARRRFEIDMKAALEDHQLVVHYQPVVTMDGGSIDSIEALVRWDHPHRGLLSARDFIQMAEETGQIVDIGRHVLSVACRQTRDWQVRLEMAHLNVNVNVSSLHFRSADLVPDIAAVLAETGLPPQCLILDITESSLLADLKEGVVQMKALKKLGIRIALDDFGTDYASVRYLRELPVDVIKVDPTFFADIGAGKKGREFVRALAALSHSLQLSIISEGVEQADHARLLRALGVDCAQGYYFSEPIGSEQMEAMLARRPFLSMGSHRSMRPTGDDGERATSADASDHWLAPRVPAAGAAPARPRKPRAKKLATADGHHRDVDGTGATTEDRDPA